MMNAVCWVLGVQMEMPYSAPNMNANASRHVFNKDVSSMPQESGASLD
jgi:hypothetical protein